MNQRKLPHLSLDKHNHRTSINETHGKPRVSKLTYRIDNNDGTHHSIELYIPGALSDAITENVTECMFWKDNFTCTPSEYTDYVKAEEDFVDIMENNKSDEE